MSLIVKDTEFLPIEPTSEGLHAATCIAVVDLGHQYSKAYDTWQDRLVLMFEIHDETIEIDGQEKPRVISKEYTKSLNPKATLLKDLESWRGKKFTEKELDGFNVGDVLGKPCQIQVLHVKKETRTYANIASIVSWIKGVDAPKSEIPLVLFDIEMENATEKLKELPAWLQKRIMESEEMTNVELPEEFET